MNIDNLERLGNLERLSNSVVKKGRLYRYRGRFRGWKLFKFELNANGELKCYKKSNINNVVNMETALVIISNSNPCRFEVDDSGTLLHLRTTKPCERDEWVSMLLSVKGKFSNRNQLKSLQATLSDLHNMDRDIGVWLSELYKRVPKNSDMEKIVSDFKRAKDEMQRFLKVADTLNGKLKGKLKDIENDDQLVPIVVSDSSEDYFDANSSMEDDESTETEMKDRIGDEGYWKMATSFTQSDKEKLIQSTKYSCKIFNVIPPDWKPRDRLVNYKKDSGSMSLIRILKNSIGKDLSQISIPVQFSEPLSLLQRFTESFYYSSLLNKASSMNNPIERMLYVAGFACSIYSGTDNRFLKPFNPLLGETYEYINNDFPQYRVLFEQVSHHPPISACMAFSKEWTLSSTINLKNKFWGKSIEIYPTGLITCELTKWNEIYLMNRITTCVHNVTIGSKWIENYGTLNVINEKTKQKCIIEFKRRGWFDKKGNVVEGVLYDENNVERYKLMGFWDEKIEAIPILPSGDAEVTDNSLVLFQAEEEFSSSKSESGLSLFSIRLNECPEWMRNYLPGTDCRLRPDLRALEEGDYDLAASEKFRLEKKQREARAKGKSPSPLWFEPNESGNWIYKGRYWECRMSKNWPELPDIY